MPQKSKILIVENAKDTSGAFNSILNSTIYLKENFDLIFAIQKNSKVIKLLINHGFPYYEFNFIEIQKSFKIFLYFPFLIFNSIRLFNLIKKEKVAILHVNDLYNLTGIIIKLIYPTTILIYHVRLLPGSYVNSLYKIWSLLIVKFADKIICVSQAVYDNFSSSEKATLIHDNSNITSGANGNRKNHKSLVGDMVKVLYLSHYVPGKGQNFALEAFAKAVEKTPNMKLRFVGGHYNKIKNYEYKDVLIKRATELGISKFVEFLGSSENVQEEYKNADIFLNFSESESFSMTTLEALNLGVPTIATDCGGPAELFEHGQSGILVSNRNVVEMAEAIIKLASDIDLRTKFSINSVQYVQEKFSAINTYERLKNLYEQVQRNEIK